MSDPCTKASKIDSIERKLNELSGVIHKSTNGTSLLGMAKNTNKEVKSMSSDVRALLTFQTVVETRREVNDEVKEKKIKKQLVQIALIGLVVGSVLTLLGMVIAMVIK